ADPVTLENPDLELAHLSGGVGQDLMTVLQHDSVVPVGEHLGHYPFHLDSLFLCHPGSPHDVTRTWAPRRRLGGILRPGGWEATRWVGRRGGGWWAGVPAGAGAGRALPVPRSLCAGAIIQIG